MSDLSSEIDGLVMRVLAAKPDNLTLCSQAPRGSRKELTPAHYPDLHMHHGICAHMHTYRHIVNNCKKITVTQQRRPTAAVTSQLNGHIL